MTISLCTSTRSICKHRFLSSDAGGIGSGETTPEEVEPMVFPASGNGTCPHVRESTAETVGSIYSYLFTLSPSMNKRILLY